MTIRQTLLKRQWLFVASMAVAIAIHLGVMAMFLATEDSRWFYAELFAVPPALIGIFGILFFVRCPKCNGNLGGNQGRLSARKILWLRPRMYCAYCGVSLDSVHPKP